MKKKIAYPAHAHITDPILYVRCDCVTFRFSFVTHACAHINTQFYQAFILATLRALVNNRTLESKELRLTALYVFRNF